MIYCLDHKDQSKHVHKKQLLRTGGAGGSG